MDKAQVILFAGTTEGRMLGEELAEKGVRVLLSVATPYGGDLVRRGNALRVRIGRLDRHGIAELLREEGCPPVADTTHPYAREVSENIRAACGEAGALYLRLVRDKLDAPDVRRAGDCAHAARILTREGGRALLAVGSKELDAFTTVPDYAERLFARVLPMAGVVEKCAALGFSGRHLICMQGPFGAALNEAMLRELAADWMVTKDSGETGGIREKLAAARRAGVRLLVISRPAEETGYGYGQLRQLLLSRFGIEEEINGSASRPRFPMFVDLRDEPVAVIGGGTVACRRVHTLLQCGASVRVIAPRLGAELEGLADSGAVQWSERGYAPGDLKGMRLAVTCTDDRSVNERVAADARQLGVPCSTAHNRDAGSFWFPAFVRANSLVAGIVSDNGDHGTVRRAAAYIREKLGEQG